MLGFRINRCRRRVQPEIVARFRTLPAADVSDVMARMVAAGPRLRPMHAGGTMVGPAFTVKTRPGDNLMVHKALDLAELGNVIVVDAGGDLTNALIGEPGDLILGDNDGLVCVKFDQVESVWQAAHAKHMAENTIIANIRAGEPQDRGWIDDALPRLGCDIEPAIRATGLRRY